MQNISNGQLPYQNGIGINFQKPTRWLLWSKNPTYHVHQGCKNKQNKNNIWPTHAADPCVHNSESPWTERFECSFIFKTSSIATATSEVCGARPSLGKHQGRDGPFLPRCHLFVLQCFKRWHFSVYIHDHGVNISVRGNTFRHLPRLLGGKVALWIATECECLSGEFLGRCVG